MYLLRADMTSKAVHFIQPFLLMSSLMAESITQESWRKIPDLVTSKHPSESRLWRVFRIKGVIQCGVLCGQDDHCNSFQYSFLTRICSGFHGRVRAYDVTEGRIVSYVRHIADMPCPEDEGYKLHRTMSGIPLCFKHYTNTVLWEEARERCHADKAELIIPDSAEKVDFLYQYLKEHAKKRNFHKWLGLVKEVHDGKTVYRWLNNSTDIKWGVGEPDVSDDQECGQIDKNGVSDMQCYRRRKFICEKN